jgi:hypothetical protein
MVKKVSYPTTYYYCWPAMNLVVFGSFLVEKYTIHYVIERYNPTLTNQKEA